MKSRLGKLLTSIIVIAAGIMFIVMGIKTNQNRKAYQPVTGVISQIVTTVGTSDNSDDHRVFVKYTVDGTEYEEELGEYSSSMREGNEIDLLYDPEYPKAIQKAGMTAILIQIGFGALAIVAGIAFLLKSIR